MPFNVVYWIFNDYFNQRNKNVTLLVLVMQSAIDTSFALIIYMKTQQIIRKYWCHSCQSQFSSSLQPGQHQIECPSCQNPFCELLNSNSPKYFQPYQKQPRKKEASTLKIGRRATPLRLIQLHQILQEQQNQRQGIQVTHEDLARYYKILQNDSECSVCREDLKKGEEHLVFRCRHSFHKDCLVDWLKIKNSCPTCRRKMIPTD